MSFPSTPLVRPDIATGSDEKAVSGGAFGNVIHAAQRWLQKSWFCCLIIGGAGVVCHLPAIQGERLWDDHYLADSNPFIKSPLLIFESFRHYLFLDSFSVHYRPVQNISYMADYFFWNTNEFGFHLTNILLHAGSGVLLFFLLRELVASFFTSNSLPVDRAHSLEAKSWITNAPFFVALLWTVHPVHSAAIDYISGRADSLAFLFAAAGWLLYLRGTRAEWRCARVALYILAAISGLLGLCSREIAIVWILLFCVHVLFVAKRVSRQRKIAIVFCCAALIGAYAGLHNLPAKRPVVPAVEGWNASTRMAVMARALGDYGRLLIFPSNLHMERTVFNPFTYRNNSGWRNEVGVEYLSISGLAVLAVLVAGCIVRGKGQGMRRFGAFWFLGAYLPISNIVQLNATVAEHWLYLPSVGFLIFLTGWVVEFSRHQRVFATLALVGACALGVRSYVRSTDWVTPETFYRRTIAAGGISARTGLNLAQIYANQGKLAEAEKIFRQVVAASPDYPIALNNLASVLAREGKNKEAEEIFSKLEKNAMKSRDEYPCTWMGALNLARMRHNGHDDAAAIAIVDRAEIYFPEVWELIRMKSEILRETKGPDAALELVQDFAQKNWWHHGAAMALGRLYAQRDNETLADAAFLRASQLDVHDTEAIGMIVQMRLRQNRLPEAFQLQRRAVARQPDEPRQYVLLSDILVRMGRNEEAQAALAQAAKLRDLVAQPVAGNSSDATAL